MKPAPVLFGGVTVAALEPPHRNSAAVRLCDFGIVLELLAFAFGLLARRFLLSGVAMRAPRDQKNAGRGFRVLRLAAPD